MFSRFAPLLGIGAIVAAGHAQTSSFIVPAGQTVVYDTSAGPIFAGSVHIEPGATLRIVGAQPFKMYVGRSVWIEGVINVSGFDSQGVNTLQTANIPEPGALGVAGGGDGGVGSPLTNSSDPKGGDGVGLGAGRGGETGWNPSFDVNKRRPGGGGGGAFGPDQPVVVFPDDPANLGRIALPGRNGSPLAIGAISSSLPPLGGARGISAFTDGLANNDFFGRVIDPNTGLVIVGELAAPRAGTGGGAGGDSTYMSFPNPNYSTSDAKGAGGGGGGGLAIIVARRIVLGPAGRILSNGGTGGGGENTIFLNRVGGGSGGGSGGMLILQARQIDLSQADSICLRALGGRGGVGALNAYLADDAGGNGGPGLIQLHTSGAARGLVLAPGVTLDQLSAPTAHMCLLEPGL